MLRHLSRVIYAARSDLTGRWQSCDCNSSARCVLTYASERWMPFQAEHIIAPHSTGFVWNARVRIAPLLHVRVRDSLV